MKLLSAPVGPSGLILISLALFAVPAHLEGAVLLPISPGHAISTLDGFAVLLLIIGSTWLNVYFWQQRKRLGDVMRRAPGLSKVALFLSGLGLGLLIASAFSTFFWWWVLGAVLYGLVLAAAIVALETR